MAVVFADPSGTTSAEVRAYKRVPATSGIPPPPTLSAFISTLRQAADTGDASFILRNVAPDFQCLRDFGGVCTSEMKAREKFSAVTGLAERPTAGLGELNTVLRARHFESTTAHGTTTPILCGPAAPKFDQSRVAQIDKSIFSGDGEIWFSWLAVEGGGVAAYSKPTSTATVLSRLTQELVHVDTTAPNPEAWIAVDLPSGVKAYLRQEDTTVLLPAQICFNSYPSVGWQISAFVGGGD